MKKKHWFDSKTRRIEKDKQHRGKDLQKDSVKNEYRSIFPCQKSKEKRGNLKKNTYKKKEKQS